MRIGCHSIKCWMHVSCSSKKLMKTYEKTTGQWKKIIMILFHMSMKAYICFLKIEYFVCKAR